MEEYFTKEMLRCTSSRYGVPGDPYDMRYALWKSEVGGDKYVICLHGITGNGRHFDYLARDLSRQGYNVICPDIVGRGESDYLSEPKHYGYPLYVAAIVELMESLELQSVDIIGTSMGGLMGLMIASAYPDKVKRLVINDIGPYIDAAPLNELMSNLAVKTTFQSQGELREFFVDYLRSFGIAESSEYFDYLIAVTATQAEGGSYALAFDPNIMVPFKMASGIIKTLPSIDLWHVWEGVNVPCLVLRGAESMLFSEDVFKSMCEKDKVDGVVFDNVGHAPMLMDEHQRSVILGWLE